MGYSHEYGFKEPVAPFPEYVLADVRKIVDRYKDLIQFEDDDPRPPVVTSEYIRFNGKGQAGYETLVIVPDETHFCKTAYKPYDAAVCEVLLVLRHHYGDKFTLASDGFWVSREDFKAKRLDGCWNQAFRNVKEKFGYTFKLLRRISNSHGHAYYSFEILESRAA